MNEGRETTIKNKLERDPSKYRLISLKSGSYQQVAGEGGGGGGEGWSKRGSRGNPEQYKVMAIKERGKQAEWEGIKRSRRRTEVTRDDERKAEEGREI